MRTQSQTSKEYFTVLTILHAAMLIGQLFFMSVVYFLVSSDEGIISNPDDENFTFILQVIATVLVIGGMAVSQLLGKSRLKIIRNRKSLSEKLKDYRAILILKYALLEGPALTTLVFFLLTGKMYFLLLVLPLILVFFLERPSKYKVVSDLALKKDERLLLDNPDAIVC